MREHIGDGEMGSIYRATDESLNRDVAVKLVRGCHADDPESCERLRREARAAGKLNHPRVAQVYALNFSNGQPYLVMELVTGEDFAQKLEREKRIDERTVLRMALDVADGLSALNREGLVHGDIKPGNIVLDRDGNAKLVDFGLSGMTRRDGRGDFVGTPNYIAPELLRGAVDTHRSDLYSLGVTLYHLLSGRLPHDGETPEDVLKARLQQPPIPLGKHARHVSFTTRKLVMRMLEISPAKRQANSEALAAEIREALARLDSTASDSPGPWRLLSRFFQRLRLTRRPQRSRLQPPRYFLVTVALCLTVVIAFLIATNEPLLDQLSSWRSVVVRTLSPTQADTPSLNKSATTHLPVPAHETKPNWKSTNLGENTQRGSTIQVGETLTIQGTGTDMWQGYDSCRFVWTKTSGDYVFSAQIVAITDNSSLATTGLLVKGDDLETGPGLLFGFLGSGELFLQLRQPKQRVLQLGRPKNSVTIVKRSGQPLRLPTYLKISRRGSVFETSLSPDGNGWTPFAACELNLPAGNTVGFVVSAQELDTLATAKFASIRLKEAALTNDVTEAQPLRRTGQAGQTP